jgi:hypothetical protein
MSTETSIHVTSSSGSDVVTGAPAAVERDRWVTAALWAAAAVCMGQAVQIANGTYHPVALAWMTAAFVCLVAALALPSTPTLERAYRRAVPVVLAVGLGAQLWQLASVSPGQYVAWEPPRALLPFRCGVLVVASLAVLGLSGLRLAARAWFPAVLCGHVLLGAFVIERSPLPFIDVFMYHREASRALLQGQNPYSARYPDIYGTRLKYDGPGLSENGWMKNGFPYPPASLLFALPGYAAVRDFRYSSLAAVTLTGFLIGVLGVGRIPKLAAALFLFMPRTFYVVEMGWTEPFAALMLSITVYLALRRRPGLAASLGVFFALKQHLLLLAPLTHLLPSDHASWRSTLRRLIAAGAAASLLTVPFLLWDPGAFVSSVVLYHVQGPFRIDALSFASDLARRGIVELPSWVGFAALVPASVACLRRLPRTPAAYAGAVASTLLPFFLFGIQAFCNYFFFLIAALCTAVAATRGSDAGRAGR